LIAGDLLSSLSTIVVAPPDGDMDDYLASLERAATLKPSALFPAHGALLRNSVDRLHEIRDHRLEREAAVLKAYLAGKTTPEAMVAEVYHDVPTAIHPVACWQIAAHLERLRKIGEIS
jgi:glyoxylase-like metal-dependent hydrolase (beta-lactamase superfamily II)